MDEQKNNVPEVAADESLLAGTTFGKSREQLEEEALVARQEARRQKEEERRIARAASRQARLEMSQSRSGLIFLLVLVALVVLSLVVGLIWGGMTADRQKEAEARAQNEELPYFEDDQAQAELSAEGIKGAITKAYYTTGGYLAITFDLGNGTDADQHPTSVYVELSNEDEVVLATGFSDDIEEDYVIGAGEHSSFLMYISPEYVQVTDDDLDQLAYTITIDSTAA